mmetsp:Transcript_41365/g.81589  ORF Transcript_41365/g.81589 Transcript_41365/m.81589 type:complete len:118 (+) Transcript_41365:677-1030(+)
MQRNKPAVSQAAPVHDNLIPSLIGKMDDEEKPPQEQKRNGGTVCPLSIPFHFIQSTLVQERYSKTVCLSVWLSALRIPFDISSASPAMLQQEGGRQAAFTIPPNFPHRPPFSLHSNG